MRRRSSRNHFATMPCVAATAAATGLRQTAPARENKAFGWSLGRIDPIEIRIGHKRPLLELRPWGALPQIAK